jgi:predicted ArsR family transcriptional regulator
MRYRETGNLHYTFHDSVRFVMDYLSEHYGQAGLEEVIRANALEVHRSIKNRLDAGDPSELVAHWIYYLNREEAPCNIHIAANTVTIEIPECPAFRELHKMGRPVSEHLCLGTRLTNQFWCENSPFECVHEKLGEAHCRQTFKRRAKA